MCVLKSCVFISSFVNVIDNKLQVIHRNLVVFFIFMNVIYPCKQRLKAVYRSCCVSCLAGRFVVC